MTSVTYDSSFDGLLTAVFEVYEYKLDLPQIYPEDAAPGNLFGKIHSVQTDLTKADRVFKKLKDKLTPNGLRQLYKTFLSELRDIENVLFRYMKYAIDNHHSIENDYTNADVLLVQQISRKVDREKHRMTAFVRFQCTKDNLYFSLIQPDFNVLTLISSHFEKRYADQRWMIYDSRRKIGLFYDLKKIEEVSMQFEADLENPEQMKAIYDEHEDIYQQLWQQYFQSVNIAARKNMKLHIQHMPKRYWRNLVEKKSILR